MKIEQINFSHPLFAEFLALPYKPYPGKMDWVAPFQESTFMDLSPGNSFFKHGECALFVAVDNGNVIGRISASLDHLLKATEKTGHIGYFEVIQDEKVAFALIQTAEAWLKDKGTKIVHGPLNLNIYTGYRLMTSGHDREAYLGEPRTLPYYEDYFLLSGYKTHSTWKTFELSVAHQEQIMREMEPKVKAYKDPKLNYKIIPLGYETFEEELKELYPLCLSIFQENYGYADMTLEEFLAHYAPLKSLYIEHYFLKVVDESGKPIAFSYVYPNRVNDFKLAQGSYHNYKASNFKSTAVLSVFGVSPAYRKTTIAYELVLYTFDHVKKNGSTFSYASLTKEGKTFMDHLDCPVRTYSIYDKKL